MNLNTERRQPHDLILVEEMISTISNCVDIEDPKGMRLLQMAENFHPVAFAFAINPDLPSPPSRQTPSAPKWRISAREVPTSIVAQLEVLSISGGERFIMTTLTGKNYSLRAKNIRAVSRVQRLRDYFIDHDA